jgi:hypothetical protein
LFWILEKKMLLALVAFFTLMVTAMTVACLLLSPRQQFAY